MNGINIFSIDDGVSTTGEWEGIEFLRANAGFGINVGATGEANFCHGMELALGLNLDAQAQATLSIFAKAAGTVKLDATVGANIISKFETNLLDKFGILVDVGAFAKAEAALALELGLNIEQIKEAAQISIAQNADPLEEEAVLAIFDAFLDQLDLKAGVWAGASFSAMARAYMNIYGSMEDPKNSGFIIEVGAAAGLEAGVSFDFFAAADMTNSGAFYMEAGSIIVNYLESKVDAEYPEHAQIIKGIGITFGIIGCLAYAVVNVSTAWFGSNNEEAAKKAVLALLDSYKQIVLQAIMANIGSVIDSVIREIVNKVMSSSSYSVEKKSQVSTSISNISKQLLKYKALNFKVVNRLSVNLVNILEGLHEEDINDIKEPLAILWCAAAISYVVTQEEHSAGLKESSLSLPRAPRLVLDELGVYRGVNLTKIPISVALDYIVTRPTSNALHETLPAEWNAIWDTFSNKLNLMPGNLLSAILYEEFGGQRTDTQLYVHLKGVLKEFLVEAEANIVSRTELDDIEDEKFKEYLNEVIHPSFFLMNEFILVKIDEMIVDGTEIDLEKFKQSLSLLLYKIVMKNIVVISVILQSYVQEEMENQFDIIINKLNNEQTLPLLEKASQEASKLAGNLVSQNVVKCATKDLFIDLFTIGKLLYGKVTWSERRREKLKNILLVGLTGEDYIVKLEAGQTVETYIDNFFECNNIPNPDSLQQISELFSNVMIDQMSILLEYLPPVLAKFMLTLTYEYLDNMATRVEEAIDEIVVLINYLDGKIDNLIQEIEELKQLIKDKTQGYSNQLEEIKNYLDSSSRVDTIINRIYAEGLFILSGDNDGDVTTIILGVYNTGFTIFRPLLKAALSIVIPGFLDTIISLLDTATEIDDLVNEFSTEIVSKIKEVTEPLPLPDELTPETIAQIVKENLLTGELKELLGLLLGIATTKAEAQRNQAEKLLEKAEKEELGRINRVHHEEAISSVEKIEIISPENIEQQGSHKYALGPKVDVELFLKGATISRVEEGSLQRVFISVNGKRINYRYSDWHIDSNGIRYMQTLDLLSSVIHAGINVFECSIIHEGTVKKRASSTFIVDPNAPPLNSIAVDIIASQFNVPNKNDHRNTEEEYVSFINNGLEEVDIEGWVLSDAKKHIYILPAEIIKPGETFKVVTGEGVNTNRIFYIGRHAAIWNNPGDLVRLIDKNTNLRTLYSYPIE